MLDRKLTVTITEAEANTVRNALLHAADLLEVDARDHHDDEAVTHYRRTALDWDQHVYRAKREG